MRFPYRARIHVARPSRPAPRDHPLVLPCRSFHRAWTVCRPPAPGADGPDCGLLCGVDVTDTERHNHLPASETATRSGTTEMARPVLPPAHFRGATRSRICSNLLHRAMTMAPFGFLALAVMAETSIRCGMLSRSTLVSTRRNIYPAIQFPTRVSAVVRRLGDLAARLLNDIGLRTQSNPKIDASVFQHVVYDADIWQTQYCYKKYSEF